MIYDREVGGVGCLGTPVVRTDAAAILATSKTWWLVPPTVKIVSKVMNRLVRDYGG